MQEGGATSFTYSPFQPKVLLGKEKNGQNKTIPLPALQKSLLPKKPLPARSNIQRPIVSSHFRSKGLPQKKVATTFKYSSPSPAKLRNGQTITPPPTKRIPPPIKRIPLPSNNKPQFQIPVKGQNKTLPQSAYPAAQQKYPTLPTDTKIHIKPVNQPNKTNLLDISFDEMDAELESMLDHAEASYSQKMASQSSGTPLEDDTQVAALLARVEANHRMQQTGNHLDSIPDSHAHMIPSKISEKEKEDIHRKEIMKIRAEEEEKTKKKISEAHKERDNLLAKEIKRIGEEKMKEMKEKISAMQKEQDSLLSQEIQKYRHEEAKMNQTMSLLKKEIFLLKKMGSTPLKKKVVAKKEKKEEEEKTEPREAPLLDESSFSMDMRLIPLKKIGKPVCILMEKLGQKTHSQLERTKSFGAIIPSSSSQRVSQVSGNFLGSLPSSASQNTTKNRTESLSELRTICSFSTELERTYSRVLAQEIPCHTFLPLLTKLCDHRDPLVIEQVLIFMSILLENCLECCEYFLSAQEIDHDSDEDSYLLLSSCEKEQTPKIEKEEENLESTFYPHQAFTSDNILTHNAKRKRVESTMKEEPPLKKQKLFLPTKKICLFASLKCNEFMEFAKDPVLVSPLLRIFLGVASYCPTAALYDHFEFLFSNGILLTLLRSSNTPDMIEIQSLSLDILFILLKNKNIVHLARVKNVMANGNSFSILDSVLSFCATSKYSSGDISASLSRSIRLRSVRIFCLLASVEGEFSVDHEKFLGRLIVLLHYEVESIRSCNHVTQESVLLIRTIIQLLVMIDSIVEFRSSIIHRFTSAMHFLIHQTSVEGLRDLVDTAKGLRQRFSPVS